MRIQATTIVLGVFLSLPLEAALADARSEWPNPAMSNADLRKSCASEASRVYRLGRGFRTDRTYMTRLRRDYRKDCVDRVKRQRKGGVHGLGVSEPLSGGQEWS